MFKTKFYISLMLAALTLGTTTSCSDFLDEDNKVGDTADLAYGTVTGMDGLMASCYSYARLWYGKSAALGLSEMGTDEFYYGNDNKQKSLLSYNITPVSLNENNSDNPCLDQYWEAFFSAINTVNTAIEYIPKNQLIGANKQNQYMGEALFLRAFYYWHMVNMWGVVPYYTEPMKDISSNAVRDLDGQGEAGVYGHMLSDLDQAISLLNSNDKSSGHVTKAAAYAFKARVLLYAASWLMGQQGSAIAGNANYAGKSQNEIYQLADDAAAQAISQSGLSLQTNYANVWDQNNEAIGSANNECLWGIEYNSTLSNNVLPYRFKVDSDGNPLDWTTIIARVKREVGGGSVMALMFVGKWDNAGSDLADIMKRCTDANTTFTNRITGKVVEVNSTYSRYSRGFTRYVPSLYLLDLFNKVKDTDQRYEATIRDHYNVAAGLEGSSGYYPLMQDTAIYYSQLDGDSPEGQALQAWAKFRYRLHFRTGGGLPGYTSSDPSTAIPTTTAPDKTKSAYANVTAAQIKAVGGTASALLMKNMYNSVTYSGEQSFTALKKFEDGNTTTTPEISDRDIFVLRLSEMYLIQAECRLATSGSGAALSRLNDLRTVRAISGKDNSIKGTVDINTILDERALELVGEYQRWFDLKRTGKLIERVKKYNAQASANIDAHHLLRPIPQAQLDAVTGAGFPQNPGY